MVKSKVELAPIVLFIYNRPIHTKRVLQSLSENFLAKNSILYVFCDGARTIKDSRIQVELLDTVNQYRDKFKKMFIDQRAKNIGLASNITTGVTKVVREHGKVIVLEDDIITSPYFLNYMNDALVRYKDDENVMHINGYNPALSNKADESSFFTAQMYCWGWATWEKSWRFFSRETDALIKSTSLLDIWRVSFGLRTTTWHQILQNKFFEIDTWAAFWMMSIYKNKGLCLTPPGSYCGNIGLDGSGTNFKSSEIRKDEILYTKESKMPATVKIDIERTELCIQNATTKKQKKRMIKYILKQRYRSLILALSSTFSTK